MRSAFRLVAAVGGVGALLWLVGSNPTAAPAASAAPAYTVSGPYTHDNLSVFLLHGPDSLPARPVKTLDEALAAGTAVVYDEQSVNTLCVENLSDSDDLMMQNGDILKGGRQDRVLQVAMILPPKSGRVAVPAFCVERSRWQQRGTEVADRFAANPSQIAGKALKHAVNTSGEQAEVWKNVAVQQAALTAQVGKAVNGAASPTSLQLALEDKELQAKLAGYRAALAGVLTGKHRAIGYAVAVNGKITGAEVFGSSVLLAKAWPKAVGAAAVEALSEKKAGAAFAAATDDTVNAFLADAAKDQTGEQVASRENAGLEVMRETALPSYPPVRGLVLESPRVTDDRIETPLVRGGLAGFTTVNPTLSGRSAATRTRMVTGNGGQQGQQSEELNLRALNAENPAPQAAAPRNALLELSGNTFNAWQLGYRQNAGGQRAAAGPAVQAPPVTVNRTAGANGVMVESRDKANPGVVIHRTFIAK